MLHDESGRWGPQLEKFMAELQFASPQIGTEFNGVLNNLAGAQKSEFIGRLPAAIGKLLTSRGGRAMLQIEPGRELHLEFNAHGHISKVEVKTIA